MLCVQSAWEFSGRFPDYTIFKLEIFRNCKEIRHIMTMIIAITYIFY